MKHLETLFLFQFDLNSLFEIAVEYFTFSWQVLIVIHKHSHKSRFYCPTLFWSDRIVREYRICLNADILAAFDYRNIIWFIDRNLLKNKANKLATFLKKSESMKNMEFVRTNFCLDLATYFLVTSYYTDFQKFLPWVKVKRLVCLDIRHSKLKTKLKMMIFLKW